MQSVRALISSTPAGFMNALSMLATSIPSLTSPSDTLPQWAAALVILFTVWAIQFVSHRKPDAILQEERRRRDQIIDMMQAVLAYADAEDAKPADERKMPEADRVLKLLWDETHDCRTTAWGISTDDPLYLRCEALYRLVARLSIEKAIDATRRARVPGAIQAADKEDAKRLTEHVSGEKLDALIKTDAKVRKTLGKSFTIDAAVRREATELLRTVHCDQWRNVRALLKLVRPVVPDVVVATAIGMLHTALRSVFHQIGMWVATIEKGVSGDTEGALRMLFNLWVGHMLIKLIELPEFTYMKRSKNSFGNIVRNGVLSAMVRQDYEYFDRTSPGVLQDRLNRDADELGENLIGFPKETLEQLVWVGSNLLQVYLMTPRAFFLVACAPVAIMCLFQYFTFKFFRECNERARKVAEEGISATSETLRQIKTVRQFASEQRAAANYARRNLARQLIGERITTFKRALEVLVWVIFDSGICLTIIVGLPYVHSGVLTPATLIDCFCKLNFNVNFCLREILEKIPRMARLLEPLGRICDLLQATPTIEPPAHPAHVDVADATQLAALLDACTVQTDAKGATRVTLTRAVDAVDGLCPMGASAATTAASTSGPSTGTDMTTDHDDSSTMMPAVGAQLTFLSTADHRYVTPAELTSSDATTTADGVPHARPPAGLTYPVRATFSTELRPARFRGAIEFRDVHFAYPTDLRKPVLCGLSFTVEPGEKVALVGPTGCGKSSCMSLVQRLYEPTRGSIVLDGLPLASYDVHHLRSRVVIVDQHTVLFSTSIRDNITYGMDRTVSEQEVIEACVRAKAWDFIDEKPDKLMTYLKEGSNLSGGQKQRLAIARAILRQPDVILLDEATSALDNANEALVQKALDELAREGSALVIAHRLSTIKDADKIVVVDHGRAVEIGTHDELLDTNRLPLHLASSFGSPLLDECVLSKQPTHENVGIRMGSPGRCSRAREWLDTVPGRAPHDSSPTPSPQPAMVRRQRSTPSSLLASGKASKGVTYRQLWDAATGATEASTLTALGTKIDKVEAELAALKAKQARMLDAKRSLLSPSRLGSNNSSVLDLDKIEIDATPCTPSACVGGRSE